jgi:hypothetical protein
MEASGQAGGFSETCAKPTQQQFISNYEQLVANESGL